MPQRFFIEGVHYSPEQILDAWVVGDSRTEESPATSGNNATKTLPASDNTIIALLTSMTIGKKSLLQHMEHGYRFNYVGVIAAGDYLFPILPKYYGSPDGSSDEHPISPERAIPILNEILAAIRKYLSEHRQHQDELRFDPMRQDSPIEQNRLGLYRFLLEDYAQHGPYYSSRRIREFNGEGNIDWPRTINQITPVLSNGSPAYMELVTSRRTRESSNLIARIQLAMLNEISVFIETTGLNDILRMPLIKQSRESLNDLGDADTLKRILQRELSTQFETRKKLLLRNMVNYLDKRSPASRNTIFAEGTGSFNLVWEDICKTLFHDAGTKMPKPRWEFFPGELPWNIGDDNRNVGSERDDDTKEENASEEFGQTQTNTLIPDVVNNEENADHSVLYILDAKYYMPTYRPAPTGNGKGSDKARIAHQPGIGDLIKQYFYMMALQRGLDVNVTGSATGTKTSITIAGNAFVLPAQRRLASDDSTADYLLVQRGRASLAFMTMTASDDKQSAEMQNDDRAVMPRHILLYEMDAEQAIRMYLHAIPGRDTRLRYLHGMFAGQGTDSMQQRRIKP